MNNKKIKVVFIGGENRSGTTLLDRILGKNDVFFSLGEVIQIWRRGFIENWPCGCGKAFRNCDFWQAVIKKAFGRLEKIDIQHIYNLQRSIVRIRHMPQLALPKLRSSRFQAHLQEYSNILVQLYRAIAQLTNYKVLIDSSKSACYALVLTEISDIELSVIHLVRDSRAVAYSMQKKKVRLDTPWKQAYMERRGLFESCLYWSIANWSTSLLKDRVKLYRLVLYESLASQPKATITQLLNSLGLSKADLAFFLTDNRVSLGISHTISGNPVRVNVGCINIKPDLEWMGKLQWYKYYTITLLTYPLLKKYYKG